jgi:hypothetical protein
MPIDWKTSSLNAVKNYDIFEANRYYEEEKEILEGVIVLK